MIPFGVVPSGIEVPPVEVFGVVGPFTDMSQRTVASEAGALLIVGASGRPQTTGKISAGFIAGAPAEKFYSEMISTGSNTVASFLSGAVAATTNYSCTYPAMEAASTGAVSVRNVAGDITGITQVANSAQFLTFTGITIPADGVFIVSLECPAVTTPTIQSGSPGGVKLFERYVSGTRLSMWNFPGGAAGWTGSVSLRLHTSSGTSGCAVGYIIR